MKKIILIGTLVLLVSCAKTFISKEEPLTNSATFELFWTDFDQHYSLFDVRSIDWDALYSSYQPKVHEGLSEADLWNLLASLIENLDDSHTVLYDGNGYSYRSGYALNEQSIAEISEELIRTSYVEGLKEVSSEDQLAYGKIKGKNIGYIYLGSMDGQNPASIHTIIEEFSNVEAILLDVRQNTGGDDRYAAAMAKAFSDGKHLIYTVATRDGPNHDDFDAKKNYYTAYDPSQTFSKPVVILTDRKTISAGEIFLLHMKSFEHVTQIGDTTAGDFSTISNMRFLPNGWHYRYSIQKVLLPNGESLDGIGHIPDMYVKNTVENIAAKEDKVLDTALKYLLDTYGID
ncbi:S41 family peptidase [Cellulophaga baltica]|uniref:Tricorn protease C1 domain-containing protein n=1 Tax=Cellulophaga baltica TaxID=76594 RepID=A0A1G7K9V1_9FLAO|nr:S41 family peptidase [Cellulophaga baltica]SDF33935.1 Tricorn protease C1 domain-containing protein [Cellulophaga baltica]